jgi:hypothetical protein
VNINVNALELLRKQKHLWKVQPKTSNKNCLTAGETNKIRLIDKYTHSLTHSEDTIRK